MGKMVSLMWLKVERMPMLALEMIPGLLLIAGGLTVLALALV